MKKVLIVTYYWPPAGGVSVQRVMYFAKYLKEFGWTPVILTVNNGNYQTIDTKLIDSVSDVSHVYKAESFEPHAILRRNNKVQPAGPKEMKKKSLIKLILAKFGDLVRLNFFIPDSRIGWYRNAVKEGNNIIQQHDIDVIFSTAPPYTPHLVAKRLSKENNIKWVADFRDPWLDNTVYNTSYRIRAVRELTKKLEKSVLEEATAVTCTGWQLSKHYKSKVAETFHEKFEVITNGYVVEGTSDADPSNDQFIITYFGSLYKQRCINTTFSAVGKFINSNTGARDQIKIRFVGDVDDYSKRMIVSLVPEKNLEFTGFLPLHEAQKKLEESALCFMIIDDVPFNETIILGKLFDYIKLGLPVLGVGPVNGDSAELLKRYGRGGFFEYSDEVGIEHYLMSNYINWLKKSAKDPGPPPEILNRKNLTRRLAVILDTVKSISR
jgi:hypothetical protein